MYSRIFGIHGTISAIVSVAILVFSGLVLDRAYLISAPAGIVEVGKLTPVVETLTLDEIVVSGKRLA